MNKKKIYILSMLAVLGLASCGGSEIVNRDCTLEDLVNVNQDLPIANAKHILTDQTNSGGKITTSATSSQVQIFTSHSFLKVNGGAKTIGLTYENYYLMLSSTNNSGVIYEYDETTFAASSLGQSYINAINDASTFYVTALNTYQFIKTIFSYSQSELNQAGYSKKEILFSSYNDVYFGFTCSLVTNAGLSEGYYVTLEKINEKYYLSTVSINKISALQEVDNESYNFSCKESLSSISINTVSLGDYTLKYKDFIYDDGFTTK